MAFLASKSEPYGITVTLIFAVACKLPEMAEIVTAETLGVAVGGTVTVALVPLPQPNEIAIRKNAMIPNPILVRCERRSNPANTIPMRANPNQSPPIPLRGLETPATEPALFAPTVTVTLAGSAPGLSEGGLNWQVASAGKPTHVNVTGASSAPSELTLTLKLPVPPAGTVNEVLDRVRIMREESTASLIPAEILPAKSTSPL
jgi:hypothetical protein